MTIHDRQVITTITNENKIGRNDPCYCGSGKKHKKCCMQIINYMNYLKLLFKPFELVLVTCVTFLLSILMAAYLIMCIIVDMITKITKKVL